MMSSYVLPRNYVVAGTNMHGLMGYCDLNSIPKADNLSSKNIPGAAGVLEMTNILVASESGG